MRPAPGPSRRSPAWPLTVLPPRQPLGAGPYGRAGYPTPFSPPFDGPRADILAQVPLKLKSQQDSDPKAIVVRGQIQGRERPRCTGLDAAVAGRPRGGSSRDRPPGRHHPAAFGWPTTSRQGRNLGVGGQRAGKSKRELTFPESVPFRPGSRTARRRTASTNRTAHSCPPGSPAPRSGLPVLQLPSPCPLLLTSSAPDAPVSSPGSGSRGRYGRVQSCQAATTRPK